MIQNFKIMKQYAICHPTNAAPPDLWPCWRALAGRPLLLVRGALSDILAPEVAARMLAEVPGAEMVIVPRTGHAPTLDEPEAVAAIERLLDRAE